MWLMIVDANDADSPSRLNGVFSGHPCPEIAVSLWEYQEILIPFQSHQSIAYLYSMLPQITICPFFYQKHNYLFWLYFALCEI